MKCLPLAATLLACAACTGGTAWSISSPPSQPTKFPDARSVRTPYPATRLVDQVDVYHGISVADPYRWLEAEENPEVKAWTDAQNALTDAALNGMPHREAIRDALRSAWNYARQSVPWRHGARYFELRNNGTQTQDVLWVQEGDQARVLLDPAQLSQNSTGSPASLANLTANADGSLMAYAVSQSGSDWQSLHVRDVRTGGDLADCITSTKFSPAAWVHDSSGFFYVHYPRPAAGEEAQSSDGQPAVFFHALGTSEANDREIFRHPDVDYSVSAEVSHDGRWLVIAAGKGSGKNELWAQDLASHEATAVRLTDAYVGSNSWVGNDDHSFLLHTTAGAPRGRVLRVALPGTSSTAPEQVINETSDALASVHWVGHTLVAKYLQDAHSLVRLHSLQGELLHTLDLPALGSAEGFDGDPDANETFYTFHNATTPPTVYRFDTGTHTQTVHFAPQLPLSVKDLVTEQVFFKSHDGTPLTAFISRDKDAPRDGAQPTLLYGYGGFNISITPTFNVANLVWMQRGGIYVSAVLRGGGEYGDDWHWAGTQIHKQNVFNDFIATAEYLIAEGYTSPQQLAINGGSNGGLLVGACLTQRPDLFGAALPEVGVLDMLRYHRFTSGRTWKDDYGTVDDADQFHALYAYSPLHNVHAGTPYPATLVITGDHDDRVVPAHSFKFAAALQASQVSGGAPIMLRVLHGTGHGAGRSLEQRVELASERLTFLENALRPRRSCCHKH